MNNESLGERVIRRGHNNESLSERVIRGVNNESLGERVITLSPIRWRGGQ